MNKSWHILVVDDDPQIGELIHDYLVQHGFRVSTARNGQEMKRVMQRCQIDLVVLDIMLPGPDGLTLCRGLREDSDVIIVMLSAVGEEADRVVGLEVGADDYLAKPFSPRELLARIKALMRRTTGAVALRRRQNQALQLPSLCFLNWTLDCNKRRLITADKITVPLSTGEYELLLAFLEHPKRTLSRDQLLDITRGREGSPFDRTIDVQVARLRKKIEENPKDPRIIITVRGGGYQFAAEVKSVDQD
ncbi:MAG: response regulator [Gammaproteobacteria bacterium]|nr:response regulator [Gammaproteobacteria bacterium]